MRGVPFIFSFLFFFMPTNRNNVGFGIIEKLHYSKMLTSFFP